MSCVSGAHSCPTQHALDLDALPISQPPWQKKMSSFNRPQSNSKAAKHSNCTCATPWHFSSWAWPRNPSRIWKVHGNFKSQSQRRAANSKMCKVEGWMLLPSCSYTRYVTVLAVTARTMLERSSFSLLQWIVFCTIFHCLCAVLICFHLKLLPSPRCAWASYCMFESAKRIFYSISLYAEPGVFAVILSPSPL